MYICGRPASSAARRGGRRGADEAQAPAERNRAPASAAAILPLSMPPSIQPLHTPGVRSVPVAAHLAHADVACPRVRGRRAAAHGRARPDMSCQPTGPTGSERRSAAAGRT